MHAETDGGAHGLGCLGCRNEEFGGHAADPRAGRAIWAALDQHQLVRVLARGMIGSHACCARADDGDIDFMHCFSPSAGQHLRP